MRVRSCEVERMMKQLSIVAALVFAVACKTDAPSQQNSAASSEESSAKPRSAKIAIKPVQPEAAAPAPAAPAPPAESAEPPRVAAPAPGDQPMRPDWRRRREARLDTNGDGV